MTSGVATGEVAPETDPADRVGTAEPWWWLVPAAVAVTILPIWVAVIRAGVAGLFPYGDAAETVLRAGQVFTGPFPLAGMSAAGGSQDGFDTYFPGAWQLYLLAGPTRVLGLVWGPLVVMGLLNTVWVGLAGWLLHRRLRRAEALVGIAFLALFTWSVGSGFLITPIPMEMIVIPTATFLVAVWAVADGDPAAIVVLAVVANFLWLDHLVLVVTVPVIGLCAVVGIALWFRRVRRPGSTEGPDAVRGVTRGLIGAAIVTIVMWIPTIVQQLTVKPGNLGQLVASAGSDHPRTMSWFDVAHYIIVVITRPMFWFRGTIDGSGMRRSQTGTFVASGLSLYDLIAWICVIGLFVVFGVLAHRRRDRLAAWLLIVAGVAIVISVVTAHSAPNYLSLGPPVGYLRATWAIAMFVWMAVGLNLVRAWRGRFAWSTSIGAFVLVVVVAIANVPTADYGYATNRRKIELVDEMLDAVVPRIEDRGVFMVVTTGFASHDFSAALALQMADKGIGYCFGEEWLRSDGSRPACPDDLAGTLTVVVDKGSDPAVPGRVLFHGRFLTAGEQAEVDALQQIVDGWLEDRDRFELSPPAQRRFDELLATLHQPLFEYPIRLVLDARGDEVARMADDPALVQFVNSWYAAGRNAGRPLFVDSPLSDAQWRRWVDLNKRTQSVVVAQT